MFRIGLFSLVIASALLTIAVLVIQMGIAPSATLNAYVSRADIVRDSSGYLAPVSYISRADILRDGSGYAAPYVSRSDTIRDASTNAAHHQYISRSDTLRSAIEVAP